MPEWIGIAANVGALLFAITALIVSIWASRSVARAPDIELLVARYDLKAAKREAAYLAERLERERAIRDARDPSDRKFEALQRRSDEPYRQSAEITV